MPSSFVRFIFFVHIKSIQFQKKIFIYFVVSQNMRKSVQYLNIFYAIQNKKKIDIQCFFFCFALRIVVNDIKNDYSLNACVDVVVHLERAPVVYIDKQITK